MYIVVLLITLVCDSANSKQYLLLSTSCFGNIALTKSRDCTNTLLYAVEEGRNEDGKQINKMV